MFADEDFEQLLILLSTIIHLQPVVSASELMAGFVVQIFASMQSGATLYFSLLFVSRKSLRRGNDFKPSPEQTTQTGSLTRRQGVENVPETF